MPRATQLHPIPIGRTPAGIDWVCYPAPGQSAEDHALDLAEMRAGFDAVCEAQRRRGSR